MGYNGNNRGRTHRWSGVGDKRYYNWGLNLTTRAIVLPFAIMKALVEVGEMASGDNSYYNSKQVAFTNKSRIPSDILKYKGDKNNKLHNDYHKIIKEKHEIRDIKRNIWLQKFILFCPKKVKRKVSLLYYLIQRKKRLLYDINITEYGVGSPVQKNLFAGQVTIHNESQLYKDSDCGCLCEQQIQLFHKNIYRPETLVISTKSWQILFYSKAMFIENKKNFTIIPYSQIKCFAHEIISGKIRHQVTLYVEGVKKSIYLIFDRKKDAGSLNFLVSKSKML